MYIVTVDNGTSSTKTVLWSAEGVPVAEAEEAYSLRRPQPSWAEMDANVWWEAACNTIRAVLAKSGVDPRQVAGVGVDGIGWTLLPVDAECNPLAPALIWLDRRAQEETDWLRGLEQADALVDLVANPIDSAYITPKLLWLRRHNPSVFAAAYRFLTASGFLVTRLTGEFTCDYTQAYGYHFFDIRRKRWDGGVAELVGVPLEKMPPLRACTDIAGGITPQAAAQTGLAPGTPVIVGCLDAAAGALGAGVTRVGQTMDQGGQAGGMALSVDSVTVDPRLIFSHHVLPGQYLLQSGTVGGGSLGWFRDVFGQTEKSAAELLGCSPFELFSTQAGKAQPGAGGLIFVPYMAGERTPIWSSTARGVFFGLSYSTTRADMLRAIMEGCAFAVYDNLKVAEDHGVTMHEWLGSGGATRSPEWCQIKADVTGRPFVVARRADGREGGHTLGLFALASHAVGLQSDIGACVEALLPQRQVFEPSEDRHEQYEELFGVYMSVSRKLLEDFDRLAEITGPRSNAQTLERSKKGAYMKAVVLEDRGVMSDAEVERPAPRAGYALLQVKAVSICGSDISRYVKGHRTYPMILGHECAGVVAAVREGVDDKLVGRHAALIPLIPCFKCEQCLKGLYSACHSYSFIGSRQSGGFAEYVELPATNLLLLPDEVSFEAAALIEPATVARHILALGNFKAGQSAVVFGAGSIGLMLVQWLRILGAGLIICTDVVDENLEAAKRLGAHVALNARNADVQEEVRKLAGDGVDLALEAAGAPQTLAQTIQVTRPRGAVVCAGNQPLDATMPMSFIENMMRKELQILGCFMSYSAPFPGSEWTESLEAVLNGGLDMDAMITHRFPLSDAPRVFESIGAHTLSHRKIIFYPDR